MNNRTSLSPILFTVTDEMAFSLRWPQPGPPGTPVAGQRPAQPRRRRRQILYWASFGLLWAAAAGLLAGAFMTLGVARASSPSMADTVQAGDLLAYQRGTDGIVRGDVVMVRVPGVDGPLARRVIGLPGDRVTCCDSAGRVTVDGKALAEDYLARGTAPNRAKLAVTVSPGQAWVMGDNRAIAVDSREWGPLPISDISGRVIEILGSRGSTLVRTPATFTADGLAPDGHRLPFPLVMAGLAPIAVLAAIVQGTAGAVIWAVRRRRRTRQQPGQTTC
jgi:signal peptidase I